jgi:hypothetical protein
MNKQLNGAQDARELLEVRLRLEPASASEIVEDEHQQDYSHTTNVDAASAQAVSFASLGPSPALPLGIDGPAHRRNISDSAMSSLMQIEEVIDIPIEVERGIYLT